MRLITVKAVLRHSIAANETKIHGIIETIAYKTKTLAVFE
ncbi:hypothetical protein Poly41_16600 [Novipirellula artificiosorum]|uniref:Uncharacterized protein n=1 Tax=Novipirellula artificiosorum TaxID=2528016 RepID=A0A5C6DWR2_9BACT|nr:hypothetical protein Poly41_16600 [Novipirellula artificiosorum]